MTAEPQKEHQFFKQLGGREARYAGLPKAMPEPQRLEVWLTVKAAAGLLSLESGDLIYRAIEAGEMFYWRSGDRSTGKIYIPYSDFDAWRKERFLPIRRKEGLR